MKLAISPTKLRTLNPILHNVLGTETTAMGYKIDMNRFGKTGDDDDRARAAIADVFAHTRNHNEPDWIDQAQAVHAVNALNNAGAVITWPDTAPS